MNISFNFRDFSTDEITKLIDVDMCFCHSCASSSSLTLIAAATSRAISHVGYPFSNLIYLFWEVKKLRHLNLKMVRLGTTRL
jgi:hypothetical protein